MTLSTGTGIRIRSAAERAAVGRPLTEAITSLAARDHDESAPGDRSRRLVIVAHPMTRARVSTKEPS